MALDEPKDSDEKIECDEFTYLVDKDFLEKVQPINVDFTSYGFHLTCAVDFSAGSACSACPSAGGCG